MTFPTPWDARVMGRSALLTSTLVALAVLLTAATDEGGLAWSERVSRAVPLVPVCGALATGLALAGRDRRGERRTLEAMGRSPLANALAAALGAATVGLLAAAAVLVDAHLDLRAFFPTLQGAAGATAEFTYDHGVFTSVRSGWHVMPDGSVALAAGGADAGRAALLPLAGETGALLPHARGCAALLTLVASAGFGLTTALAPRGRWGPAVLAMTATAVASAVCLQAVAAGRAPLLLVPVPATLLLLGAAGAARAVLGRR